MSRMLTKLSILTVALAASLSCGKDTDIQKLNVAPRTPETPIPQTLQSNERSSEPDKMKDVPVAFKNVDFKNLSYPTSGRKGMIHLKDGEYRYYRDEQLGNGWFQFADVAYVDLTGDGNSEAVVRLSWVDCGVSCDGGAALFYFYSIKPNRLRLLSRIQTGSLGHGECGLRSFVLKGKRLELETFQVCKFTGITFQPAPHANVEAAGKFAATKFTRFELGFSGREFVLRKREVFPNPQENIMNYPSKIEISND